jgi:hypothetical protein
MNRNRYNHSSSDLDYDFVIGKRDNQKKIKELEKIYLPRLDTKQSKMKK